MCSVSVALKAGTKSSYGTVQYSYGHRLKSRRTLGRSCAGPSVSSAGDKGLATASRRRVLGLWDLRRVPVTGEN